MSEYLECFRRYAGRMQQVLFDARQPGQYGGTGKTADWDALKDYPQDGSHPPLVLAGGLTPDNVAKAIRAVHPWRWIRPAASSNRRDARTPCSWPTVRQSERQSEPFRTCPFGAYDGRLP